MRELQLVAVNCWKFHCFDHETEVGLLSTVQVLETFAKVALFVGVCFKRDGSTLEYEVGMYCQPRHLQCWPAWDPMGQAHMWRLASSARRAGAPSSSTRNQTKSVGYFTNNMLQQGNCTNACNARCQVHHQAKGRNVSTVLIMRSTLLTL
jgi:hypothetical protein